MAAVHVVSLFLPYTLSFHDNEDDKGERPPRPVFTHRGSSVNLTNLTIRPAAQRNSTVDLPTRTSMLSLLNGPTPPLTPTTAAQEFFAPLTPCDGTKAASKRYSAKMGDSKSLALSDADDWASEGIYHQPRSRAGPLPSGSILDFAKVHDELQKEKLRDAKKSTSSPPQSRGSRNQSHERGFEHKPFTVENAVQGNGGLTNAMRSAAESAEFEVSWIGTLGFATDALHVEKKDEIADRMLNEHQSTVVYISDKDFSGHYKHYCKTILWPIFHYQVPDHPKSKAYADHSWKFYKNVNQAFADKVNASYKRGDTIWINDYHLLLVPGMVRKKHPDAQVGFFLHTAFPSSEIFRCLATRTDLLFGMLGANLIAFQTQEYAQHFLQTCSRLLTVETTSEGVQLEDHFVNVMSEPIGVNPPALDEARQESDVQQWIHDISERYKGKLIIVARDKLDNVHGVRQKLLAYELFLDKYPELAKKTVLIQVATSSSDQSGLLATVSDICSRVDYNHSDLVHQPLVFLKQDIGLSQYLALLSVADVLMITSLRDGMNLTGHEYVLCQDGKAGSKKYGPLILSEFTGAAAVFHEQISINPWDYHKMADAIKSALEMTDAEKEDRWKKLHAVVMNQTGCRWAEELGRSLTKVHAEHYERASTSVPRLSTALVSEKYRHAANRVFMIDYEGTLAPHKTREGIPLTSPTRVVDTMNDLMNDPKNTVYVMSGGKPAVLNSIFRTATGLGLIAENGCFLRGYGASSNQWKTIIDMAEVTRWKKDVGTILNYYLERMEGSYVEDRHCSLVFHYEKHEDLTKAKSQAGDCADQINTGCKSMRIHAVHIDKAVLIESDEFSKGTAARNIYNTLREYSKENDKSPPDFLMVVGDDREDEVVFRWANQLAKEKEVRDVFTVSAGTRNTEAQAALTYGSTGLLTILKKLARISLDSAPVDYFNSPLKARSTAEKA